MIWSLFRVPFFRVNKVLLPPPAALQVRRFPDNPIIRSDMLPGRDGDNINGPSLIRVPDWLPNRLGRYYLYFAHHKGTYIRLAFADRLEGPWKVYEPGTLRLSQAKACRSHIASPDVHVDEPGRRIRMYFHGPVARGDGQKSFVALSHDGVSFTPSDEILAAAYMRVVPWRDEWIAMTWGGRMYRSRSAIANFEPAAFSAAGLEGMSAKQSRPVRHVALHPIASTLFVYYTRIGDAPESILRSRIELDQDPLGWQVSEPELVLMPETVWEGAQLPLKKSKTGIAKERENALRDPAIFIEDGRIYLLYAVAGESGIAIAELVLN